MDQFRIKLNELLESSLCFEVFGNPWSGNPWRVG